MAEPVLAAIVAVVPALADEVAALVRKGRELVVLEVADRALELIAAELGAAVDRGDSSWQNAALLAALAALGLLVSESTPADLMT
jgi:hypothetical protein